MNKDKLKIKVKKLLELATSSNENEANSALAQAMKLMNKYNISESEAKQENLLTEHYTMNQYVIQTWVGVLFNKLSKISGTFVCCSSGNKRMNRKAQFIVSGRKKDVDNTIYLFECLHRTIKLKCEEYKKNNKNTNKTVMNSYKCGVVRGVCSKLEEVKNQFFNSSESKGIVPVDTRAQESRDWFMKQSDIKLMKNNTKSRLDANIYNSGMNDGKQINVNVPVSGQKEIKRIS